MRCLTVQKMVAVLGACIPQGDRATGVHRLACDLSHGVVATISERSGQHAPWKALDRHHTVGCGTPEIGEKQCVVTRARRAKDSVTRATMTASNGGGYRSLDSPGKRQSGLGNRQLTARFARVALTYRSEAATVGEQVRRPSDQGAR